MNPEKIIESINTIKWINNIIDTKRPVWFLLPYDIVEELATQSFFDYCTHPEIVGGCGDVGVFRAVPIKISLRMQPCYMEQNIIYWFTK